MEKPTITYSLIALNLIVFLLIFSMPDALKESAFEGFSLSQSTVFQIWRLLTSLFLHISPSHLFFNMLGLYFFGKALEEQVPRQWFLSIYFIAGLFGNLVFLLTSAAPVVGASGAMFGIMGAAMFLNPIRRIHLYMFPLPLGIIAIAFVVFETFIVVADPAFADPNVANISHVAGIVTGAVFAFFHKPKQSLKGILVLVILAVLLIILAPLFALISGIGGIILEFVDMIVGFFLLSIAKIFSFLWG